MDWNGVLAIGLALPEVEASTSYGTPALKVRGKLVTRLRPEDDSLVLPGVPAEERTMLIEAAPEVFHFTDHYRDYPIVLARLAALDEGRLWPFLVRRWQEVAPKRIASRFTIPAAPNR